MRATISKNICTDLSSCYKLRVLSVLTGVVTHISFTHYSFG